MKYRVKKKHRNYEVFAVKAAYKTVEQLDYKMVALTALMAPTIKTKGMSMRNRLYQKALRLLVTRCEITEDAKVKLPESINMHGGLSYNCIYGMSAYYDGKQQAIYSEMDLFRMIKYHEGNVDPLKVLQKEIDKPKIIIRHKDLK